MIVDESTVFELAAAVTGLPDTAEDHEIESAIREKFGVEPVQFAEIVYELIPFTIPAKSAITDSEFQGFVKDGAFLVKMPTTRP